MFTFTDDLVELRGIEPQSDAASKNAKGSQNSANSKQFIALSETADADPQQEDALSAQKQNTSARPKCATYVQQCMPADLRIVASCWDRLTEEVRTRIVTLAQLGQ